MKDLSKVAKPGLMDSHCHLDMHEFHHDFADILQRASQAGVSHIISIGTSLNSSKAAIELARKHAQINATIGVHPHDVTTLSDADYDQLKSLYYQNQDIVVAIGEIGLDFFKNYAAPDVQRYHFWKQLEIATELKIPVVIHSRDADLDTLKMLQDTGGCANGGILHCFSSNYEYAKKILDLGFLISIPGIVTYKNANQLREVVKKLPLSKLVVETDAPYLAPHPHRGQRNEPSFLQHTAQTIADIKNVTLAEVAAATSNNLCSLFNIRQLQ